MSMFGETQDQLDEAREKIERLERDIRGLRESLASYREMNEELGKRLQDAVKRIAALRKMRNSVVRDLMASKKNCSRLEDDFQDAKNSIFDLTKMNNFLKRSASKKNCSRLEERLHLIIGVSQDEDYAQGRKQNENA